MRQSLLKNNSRPGFVIPLTILIVIMFFALYLYSAENILSGLDEDIIQAQNKIEEQKILLANYQILLQKSPEDFSGVLPSPSMGRLPQDKIESIPILLKDVAQNSQMVPVSIMLDLNSLTDGLKRISVNFFLKGDIINFRKLLLKLGEIPYIEHIEKVYAQGAFPKKEFELKLWLAIES